ncbi:MAG: tRNA (N6-threonylcarbamoyladenosine(37)-N6)-methyltransferase TrmO [Akkermansiaceae bacterium]|nr:tRNA (N6-threonylcarbamoyladenosine(37)-N6)-methyltransferase TrmO [Akkermansiaceae bacterium]
MQIEPIAHVHSCFGSKFAVPRQPGLCPSAWGEVHFEPAFRNGDCLRGIEGFSHLWLVFGFHQTVGQGWKPTVRPPRLGGEQRVGVFASRSTYRPNGLGLSLVRLEAVERGGEGGPVLKVGGLDLLDGTPIYDIKPYLPYAEALPDARAGYASEEISRLEVSVEDEARAAFEALPQRAQSLIMEALALDPRPAVQTGDEGRVFGALLCGHDVRFTVIDGRCRIVELIGIAGSY